MTSDGDSKDPPTKEFFCACCQTLSSFLGSKTWNRKLASCWLLHCYTASGALIGILTLRAIAQGKPQQAFLWMLLSIFIDGTDGAFARRLKVGEHLPQIDGRRLDDIVDFTTYVIVPSVALVRLGLVYDTVWVWGPLVLMSALGFAHVAAKTEDDFFSGFPSYWNLVAIYLFFLDFPVAVNSLIVITLAALVLAPIRFIYPTKTLFWRPFTLIAGSIWALQLILLVVSPAGLPSWWLQSSFVFPLYYVGLSLYLNVKEPKRLNG